MTSALPRRISSKASPMACELAAHAVRQLAFSPLAPNRLARWADGVPGSCSASRIACSSRHALAGEFRRVDMAVVRGLVHQLHEPGKILLTFARAEVDAEPSSVQSRALTRRDPASFIAMDAADRANLLLRECSTQRAGSSI